MEKIRELLAGIFEKIHQTEKGEESIVTESEKKNGSEERHALHIANVRTVAHIGAKKTVQGIVVWPTLK